MPAWAWAAGVVSASDPDDESEADDAAAVVVVVVVSSVVVASCLSIANDFILLLIYLELTTLTTIVSPKRI
jgi:uncharacterized protein (DUF983 family)